MRLWDTATRGLWSFGEATTRICKEGPSTGSGISPVATSGRRVYWVTTAAGTSASTTCGPRRRRARARAASPRRRATSTAASGRSCSAPGTHEGVPYAVGEDDHLRRRRRPPALSRLGRQPRRLLAAGIGPGRAAGRRLPRRRPRRRALATRGACQDDRVRARAVTAVRSRFRAPIVQTGTDVRVGATTVCPPSGARAPRLPPGSARVREGVAGACASRRDAADTLLQTIPVRSSAAALLDRRLGLGLGERHVGQLARRAAALEHRPP